MLKLGKTWTNLKELVTLLNTSIKWIDSCEVLDRSVLLAQRKCLVMFLILTVIATATMTIAYGERNLVLSQAGCCNAVLMKEKRILMTFRISRSLHVLNYSPSCLF